MNFNEVVGRRAGKKRGAYLEDLRVWRRRSKLITLEPASPIIEGKYLHPSARAIRWPVVILVFTCGICIAAIGVLENIAWRWQDIWPYVFLDVGSATALAAVLFVIERSFIGEVRQEGQDTRAAVEKQRADVTLLIGKQTDRLDSLEQQVAAVRERRHTEADDLIRNARDQPSSGSILAALQRAADLGSIGYPIRVRTSDRMDGGRLSIQLLDSKSMRFYIATIDKQYSEPAIYWAADEGFGEFAERLIGELDRRNLMSEPPDFDLAGAVNRLIDIAELALNSRLGEIEPRIQGRIVEIFNDEWLVTMDGVESRISSLIIPAKKLFVGLPDKSFVSSGFPPPHGTSPALWDLLVKATLGGLGSQLVGSVYEIPVADGS